MFSNIIVTLLHDTTLINLTLNDNCISQSICRMGSWNLCRWWPLNPRKRHSKTKTSVLHQWTTLQNSAIAHKMVLCTYLHVFLRFVRCRKMFLDHRVQGIAPPLPLAVIPCSKSSNAVTASSCGASIGAHWIVFFLTQIFLSQHSDWLWAGWLRDQSSSPGRGNIFCLFHIFKTSSGAHSASYPLGTGGS
jgi:hypothetical protein